MEELFGEVISSYSRAQAIEDGVLVDVSKMAREAGFKYPTVITAAVHGLCEVPKSNRIESYQGRLWDVIYLAFLTARRLGGRDRGQYTVRIGRRNHRLIVHIGPGDTPEPVITIGLPEDM